MKVLVLNGLNPNQPESNRFKDIVNSSFGLNSSGFEMVDLHTKKIHKCRGCFDCWVRTPGECFVKDDSQHICNLIINCNLLVFLTPIVYGGYSSYLKIMLDRIIPLISPFFVKYKGEIHHKPRYNKYPALLGLGIQSYASSDEVKSFKQIIYRNSLNLHSPFFHAETFMNTDDEASVKNTMIDIILRMEDLNYAE
ncbi:MAG: flavodoxin family protein [Bacteroidales bacterium]|nr:MAG: flavodoxin family protein [Bacteroidales bacterium]